MRYAAIVCFVVWSAPAWAAEHLMHISEVLLTRNNDTDVRFVELADPALESFPNSGYKLVVYSAAGDPVQTINLNVPANTQRLLIGTAEADTVYGTQRNADLVQPLPVDGQVCFENSTAKIHCLAWGCVTNVITGAQRAPSPPTSMSVQRQANGSYQVANPTPGANNIAGSTEPNCPTEPDAPPMVDGPPMPDAGVPPDADDGGGNNNNPDDDGGCCQVEGTRGAASAGLLALGVLLVLRTRRRRPAA